MYRKQELELNIKKIEELETDIQKLKSENENHYDYESYEKNNIEKLFTGIEIKIKELEKINKNKILSETQRLDIISIFNQKVKNLWELLSENYNFEEKAKELSNWIYLNN